MYVQVLTTIGGMSVVVIWYLARKVLARSKQPTKPRQFSDPAACARIIACTGYDDSGAKNQYTNLQSRAIPNKRLIRAFDIDNSFTTSEAQRRKEFNLEAGKAIKMTENKWQAVATLAKQLVGEAIPPAVEQTVSTDLDSLVRSVCLKVVLHVLFKQNGLEVEDSSILAMTKAINSLWIQSKGTGTPTEADKNTLKQALAKVLPEMKWSSPKESPVNLIIPAYESLWRVVLSGFLQVTFVKGAEPALKLILAQFLANPKVTSLKETVSYTEASAASVDDIVRETLRLHPSVKRVYRQFHLDNGSGPEDVAADIEACQRSEALWGTNAQRFDPSRWTNASDEARNAYMAFGAPPFVCPAKAEFGPTMIGILVAAFVGHISSADWHLKMGESSSEAAQSDFDEALNGEGSLLSDRSTYEGIRIVNR